MRVGRVQVAQPQRVRPPQRVPVLVVAVFDPVRAGVEYVPHAQPVMPGRLSVTPPRRDRRSAWLPELLLRQHVPRLRELRSVAALRPLDLVACRYDRGLHLRLQRLLAFLDAT